MNTLTREATSKTPMIYLSAEEGRFEIKGRSIPGDAEVFWGPVLDWFEGYGSNPSDSTEVKIDLEYFNISSSKRLLFLLYKLNEIAETGKDVRIKWFYREDDEDMFEVGQDYAFMVKVPFEFITYDKDLELVAL
jgi:hypothetical protein